MLMLGWHEMTSRLSPPVPVDLTAFSSMQSLAQIHHSIKELGAKSGLLCTKRQGEEIASIFHVSISFLHRYALQCPSCRQFVSLKQLTVAKVQTRNARQQAQHCNRMCMICHEQLAVETEGSFSYIMLSCCSVGNDSCICKPCAEQWSKNGGLAVQMPEKSVEQDILHASFPVLQEHGLIEFIFTREETTSNTAYFRYLNFFRWDLSSTALSKRHVCTQCGIAFQGHNSVFEMVWHIDCAQRVQFQAEAYIRSQRTSVSRNEVEAFVCNIFRRNFDLRKQPFDDAILACGLNICTRRGLLTDH